MDKAYEIFASWQTLVLGLTIYVLALSARRVVETGWVGAKTNKWWNEVLLPALPIVLGVLIAVLARKFPWPEPILKSESFSAKAGYGIAVGLICGWLYARVRGFLRAGQDEKAAKDAATISELGDTPPEPVRPDALTTKPDIEVKP